MHERDRQTDRDGHRELQKQSDSDRQRDGQTRLKSTECGASTLSIANDCQRLLMCLPLYLMMKMILSHAHYSKRCSVRKEMMRGR